MESLLSGHIRLEIADKDSSYWHIVLILRGNKNATYDGTFYSKEARHSGFEKTCFLWEIFLCHVESNVI